MKGKTGNPHKTQDKKILIASAEVIRDNGIQAISFERIAKQAGLSRQLLRYYFTDLDQLIVEMCDFLASRYRELLVWGIVEVSRVERLILSCISDPSPVPRLETPWARAG